jgi:hypothetical protein
MVRIFYHLLFTLSLDLYFFSDQLYLHLSSYCGYGAALSLPYPALLNWVVVVGGGGENPIQNNQKINRHPNHNNNNNNNLTSCTLWSQELVRRRFHSLPD